MKVLVTGASGLVGGRLLQHLIALGHDVRAASRRARRWLADVEGIVLDYDVPETFVAAVRGIDAVINLASMREREANANPAAALRATAGGTLALATAAAGAGVGRFVQVSTFKVYGNSPSGRITEETPTAPQSHYSITHRAAEDYARILHPKTVVLRLANGFGAPATDSLECWDTIVNGMCRQAVVERRIDIHSSGRSWRNFVPMDDVTAAIAAAATSLSPGTYHVASDRSMQLIGMAERIAAVAEAELNFRPTVTTGASGSEVEENPLDYRREKLAAAGVAANADVDREITRTLSKATELFADK